MGHQNSADAGMLSSLDIFTRYLDRYVSGDGNCTLNELDDKFELFVTRRSNGIKALEARAKFQYKCHVGKRRSEYDDEWFYAGDPTTESKYLDSREVKQKAFPPNYDVQVELANVPSQSAFREIEESVLREFLKRTHEIAQNVDEVILQYRKARSLVQEVQGELPDTDGSIFLQPLKEATGTNYLLAQLGKDFPQVISERRIEILSAQSGLSGLPGLAGLSQQKTGSLNATR